MRERERERERDNEKQSIRNRQSRTERKVKESIVARKNRGEREN